ncbi:hypothetical protein DAPPUDRAFT_252424 [Daphnia pulex]|uniref:Uncharacterized protein n=1 Tax=Daphnia pulex TaxID=6669 RepID=E9H2M9_DAPPU|nr:hypothetical protein DAPPUDRAFT_252424 [Daphnia pulex]|eukprot:EFX74035.1 hypothetical protein DAPPUDRAFT_252424 [Daphnia pulex]
MKPNNKTKRFCTFISPAPRASDIQSIDKYLAISNHDEAIDLCTSVGNQFWKEQMTQSPNPRHPMVYKGNPSPVLRSSDRSRALYQQASVAIYLSSNSSSSSQSKIMSSSSPSMSVMEMEESSDTSREDRKSRRHRPSAAQPKGRQITRNFAHPPPREMEIISPNLTIAEEVAVG